MAAPSTDDSPKVGTTARSAPEAGAGRETLLAGVFRPGSAASPASIEIDVGFDVEALASIVEWYDLGRALMARSPRIVAGTFLGARSVRFYLTEPVDLARVEAAIEEDLRRNVAPFRDARLVVSGSQEGFQHG